jgi:cysteate synthase
MVDAWNSGSRALLPIDEHDQRTRVRKTKAYVLSNRKPPYSVVGGVYDALSDSGGYMYAVSNKEAERAGAVFLKEEG